SGTAHFYTENAEADVCGYFSTSGGWDSESGEPSKTLVYNDDGNGMPNFRISYEVEAGETYYVWVRCLSPDSSGTTVLNIEVPAAASRPSDFSWTYEKVKGETFNLTADEWNNFTSRINAFRKYKGLENYNFTIAYPGNDFMAYMYNEARIAIQEIDGYGTYIPEVESGWQISAHMMNVLVSELNSIP
ncbi:MAG: hypothetical protein IKK94_03855, partial [Clostridia bacterium]|nr:hypothetical protein [Clostridia bacterium]